MKLIKVERALEIYKKNGNKLIDEIPISLPVSQLKTIVNVEPDDEELHLPYVLNKKQVTEFSHILNLPFNFDLRSFFFVLICNGFYEW